MVAIEIVMTKRSVSRKHCARAGCIVRFGHRPPARPHAVTNPDRTDYSTLYAADS